MKRSNPGSKKTQVSDFKRLKARVGKRAPKKLNDTDTKFSTATVKVKVQNVSVDSTTFDRHGMQMVSSKGKHLSQLIFSLNHPSSSMRSSSLQGIRDAIKNTPSHVIPHYLSLIMPSVSKCIVDEDSDVRKLANSIIFQDVSLRLLETNLEDRIRPFVQLTLAYISSALHSLDQDVRYDGCCALETLCTQLKSLFMDKNRGMNDLSKLEATIPAFSVLLDDVSGGLASLSRRGVGNLSDIDRNATISKKKKKTKDDSMKCMGNRQKNEKISKYSNQKAARGEGVLKSFLAVMKITTFGKVSGSNVDDFTPEISYQEQKLSNKFSHHETVIQSTTLPDLEFLPGGRNVNNIVIHRSFSVPPSRALPNIATIEDIFQSRVHTSESSLHNNHKYSTNLTIQSELMLKLRDRYVEVTQRGYKGDRGSYMSPRDAQECMLIISNMRFLWGGYCRGIVSAAINTNALDVEAIKIKQVARSILRLILDTFVINDASGDFNSAHQHYFDTLNASMCMILSEIGSIVSDSSFEKEWLKMIFSYVIPQIDRDYSNSYASKSTLLRVVEKLLLDRDMTILGEEDYFKVLDAFGNSYFSKKNTSSGFDGRRSVRLLSSLIQRLLLDKMNNLNTDLMTNRLMTMACFLPRYLVEWQGDASEESSSLLATLLELTRHFESLEALPEESSVTHFYTATLDILDQLFSSSEVSIKKAKQSIFEKLPNAAQKTAISLLGMIGHPSDSIMKSLADICSRKSKKVSSSESLSDELLDYIFSVVYLVRRTISFQTYLNFLVTSSGILSVRYKPDKETSEFNSKDSSNCLSEREIEFITSYDKAIQRLCRYLSYSRTNKTCQMLMPVFQSWLKSSDNTVVNVVKIRAAFSALAVLSTGGKIEINELLEILAVASCKTFLCVIRSENVQQQILKAEELDAKITMPIHVLFNNTSALFIKFIKTCQTEVLSSTTDLNHKRSIIEILERLVNNKLLTKDICSDVTEELLHCSSVIDQYLIGGSLDRYSGALQMAVRQLSPQS